MTEAPTACPSACVATLSTAPDNCRDTCESADTMATTGAAVAAASRKIEITVSNRSGAPTLVPPNLKTTRGGDSGAGSGGTDVDTGTDSLESVAVRALQPSRFEACSVAVPLLPRAVHRGALVPFFPHNASAPAITVLHGRSTRFSFVRQSV